MPCVRTIPSNQSQRLPSHRLPTGNNQRFTRRGHAVLKRRRTTYPLNRAVGSPTQPLNGTQRRSLDFAFDPFGVSFDPFGVSRLTPLACPFDPFGVSFDPFGVSFDPFGVYPFGVPFCDQIKRAVVSISNNIAEGCGRTTKPDFARFLDISKGSSDEVRSMYRLAESLNFVSSEVADTRCSSCESVSKQLSGFAKYLCQ